MTDKEFVERLAKISTYTCILVFIFVCIITYKVMRETKAACAAKICPGNQVGRILAHECYCVGIPENK